MCQCAKIRLVGNRSKKMKNILGRKKAGKFFYVLKFHTLTSRISCNKQTLSENEYFLSSCLSLTCLGICQVVSDITCASNGRSLSRCTFFCWLTTTITRTIVFVSVSCHFASLLTLLSSSASAKITMSSQGKAKQGQQG